MRIWARHRIVGLTVVVGAAAILAVPGLAARPDDRAGMLGVGSVGALEHWAISSPDDRGTARGPGALAQPIRPDDRVGPRGYGAIGVAPPSVAASGDGFEWAGTALGVALVVLLGLCGALLVVNGRHLEKRPI